MNYCFFKGKVPQEPKIFTSQKGTKLAKFSVTQCEEMNGSKKFVFPNFTAFGETAQRVEDFVHKGATIAVECRYTESDYTNKNGETVKDKSFIANNVRVLVHANETYVATQQPTQVMENKPQQQSFDPYTGQEPELNITSDDLPF